MLLIIVINVSLKKGFIFECSLSLTRFSFFSQELQQTKGSIPLKLGDYLQAKDSAIFAIPAHFLHEKANKEDYDFFLPAVRIVFC